MNILLACDSAYYKRWTIDCINSIKHHVPWIKIVVVVVNPENIEEITNVEYVYDYKEFTNEESKIAYYQAIRFIKCAELFSNGELVMSIDCDTILTRPFSKEEFNNISSSVHVQLHHRKHSWMAGLVTYGNTNNFRNELKKQLLLLSLENWKYGWDQKVLNELATKFNYTGLKIDNWMSFGKGAGRFLTLKGDQKVAEKYLKNYNIIIKEMSNGKT